LQASGRCTGRRGALAKERPFTVDFGGEDRYFSTNISKASVQSTPQQPLPRARSCFPPIQTPVKSLGLVTVAENIRDPYVPCAFLPSLRTTKLSRAMEVRSWPYDIFPFSAQVIGLVSPVLIGPLQRRCATSPASRRTSLRRIFLDAVSHILGASWGFPCF